MDKPAAAVGACLCRHFMGGNDVLLHLAGWEICGTRRAKTEWRRRERTARETGLDGPQRRLLRRREAEESERSAEEAALVSLGSCVDLADRYFAIYAGVLPRAVARGDRRSPHQSGHSIGLERGAAGCRLVGLRCNVEFEAVCQRENRGRGLLRTSGGDYLAFVSFLRQPR